MDTVLFCSPLEISMIESKYKRMYAWHFKFDYIVLKVIIAA